MRLLPLDYAVRNMLRSPARLVMAVGGSMLVVLLLLTGGGFVRGMDLALRATGESQNAILMGAGSEESLERSEVDASVAGVVSASLPGIRTRAGVDYVSPEVHAQLPVGEVTAQAKRPLVLIRGVTPAAMLVHSSVRITAGRFPRAGFREIMVGSMLATKLGAAEEELAIGKAMWIDKAEWSIVGAFHTAGTVMDAEAWAALTDLKEATKRTNDSCVIVTLDPQSAEFSDLEIFTKMRVDLELTAIPETVYYARLSEFFAPIRWLVWATAGLIAVGGLFGGLNTMFAAFMSRVREIGTLQTCGYRPSAIVISLIQESLFMTACGAWLACAVGALLLDGLAIRFSLGAFGLRIDWFVLSIGLLAGLTLGLVGALPPALRCLKLEIPVALKAV